MVGGSKDFLRRFSWEDVRRMHVRVCKGEVWGREVPMHSMVGHSSGSTSRHALGACERVCRPYSSGTGHNACC